MRPILLKGKPLKDIDNYHDTVRRGADAMHRGDYKGALLQYEEARAVAEKARDDAPNPQERNDWEENRVKADQLVIRALGADKENDYNRLMEDAQAQRAKEKYTAAINTFVEAEQLASRMASDPLYDRNYWGHLKISAEQQRDETQRAVDASAAADRRAKEKDYNIILAEAANDLLHGIEPSSNDERARVQKLLLGGVDADEQYARQMVANPQGGKSKDDIVAVAFISTTEAERQRFLATVLADKTKIDGFDLKYLNQALTAAERASGFAAEKGLSQQRAAGADAIYKFAEGIVEEIANRREGVDAKSMLTAGLHNLMIVANGRELDAAIGGIGDPAMAGQIRSDMAHQRDVLRAGKSGIDRNMLSPKGTSHSWTELNSKLKPIYATDIHEVKITDPQGMHDWNKNRGKRYSDTEEGRQKEIDSYINALLNFDDKKLASLDRAGMKLEAAKEMAVRLGDNESREKADALLKVQENLAEKVKNARYDSAFRILLTLVSDTSFRNSLAKLPRAAPANAALPVEQRATDAFTATTIAALEGELASHRAGVATMKYPSIDGMFANGATANQKKLVARDVISSGYNIRERLQVSIELVGSRTAEVQRAFNKAKASMAPTTGANPVPAAEARRTMQSLEPTLLKLNALRKVAEALQDVTLTRDYRMGVSATLKAARDSEISAAIDTLQQGRRYQREVLDALRADASSQRNGQPNPEGITVAVENILAKGADPRNAKQVMGGFRAEAESKKETLAAIQILLKSAKNAAQEKLDAANKKWDEQEQAQQQARPSGQRPAPAANVRMNMLYATGPFGATPMGVQPAQQQQPQAKPAFVKDAEIRLGKLNALSDVLDALSEKAGSMVSESAFYGILSIATDAQFTAALNNVARAMPQGVTNAGITAVRDALPRFRGAALTTPAGVDQDLTGADLAQLADPNLTPQQKDELSMALIEKAKGNVHKLEIAGTLLEYAIQDTTTDGGLAQTLRALKAVNEELITKANDQAEDEAERIINS